MTLLATAGLTFIMGIPGADDIMLNYQTTSFHDTLYLRKLLGLKAAPEFEQWLKKMNIMDSNGQVHAVTQAHSMLQNMPKNLLAAA
jgi:ethanolamine ammonia-lyase large subunit